MPIPKFNKIVSSGVPINIENIDTDQIIPARFLKAIDRKNFGDNLFRDWRYNNDNKPVKDFILNNNNFSGKILIAANNFGCGSSREHAAWAIYDYGFKVVISSFFADIFKNNALNNGLLPIVVSKSELKKIFELTENNPNTKYEVCLENQTFKSLEDSSINIKFKINTYRKECMLKGLDNIDYILKNIDLIENYEKSN